MVDLKLFLKKRVRKWKPFSLEVLKVNVDFVDVFCGAVSEKKQDVAKDLRIKIAPGDLSILISKQVNEIRKKRKEVNFIAACPKSKQEMNSLLPDTYFDFMICDFPLGKRNVRMAKRHETAIAIPLNRVFSLKIKDLAKVRKNLLLIQEIGATLLLCSGADNETQIRSGKDLAAIGVFLGLKPDVAIKAVRENPNKIIERNEKRKKQGAWGVEVK